MEYFLGKIFLEISGSPAGPLIRLIKAEDRRAAQAKLEANAKVYCEENNSVKITYCFAESAI